MTTKNESMMAKPKSPSRRTFLSAMGATMASLNTAACIRKPYEKILPFGRRPEDRVPGRPEYYATAVALGGSVLGLNVRSNDGRPTKVDGNPNHPLSRGGTPPWAQASVLELYDPDRSRTAFLDGASVEPKAAMDAIRAMGKTARDAGGRGLAVLIDDTPSPTMERLLGQLATEMPGAKLYAHDGLGEANARAGAAMAGITGASMAIASAPAVMAVFDADPMATEGDTVAFSRIFAEGRDPDAKEKNRLYVTEAHVSLTGSNADHRKAVKASEVPGVLAAVAARLAAAGFDLPKLAGAEAYAGDAFVKALAADLAAAKGRGLVVVGERQPPAVHALGHLINGALGAYGAAPARPESEGEAEGQPAAMPARQGGIAVWIERSGLELSSAADLVEAMKGGEHEYVVVLGGNPAHELPGFGDAMGKAQVLHLGLFRNETGRLAKLHVPRSHYLEAWGDLQARDGTVSVQQPLIAPLHESASPIEILTAILGQGASGYEQVKATYKAHVDGDFEKTWAVWLHDGIVDSHPVKRKGFELTASGLVAAYPKAAGKGTELVFIRDLKVMDGRFANSPWLQELPDPITKLTWDNAAILGPKTAKKLGVKNEQMVSVSVDGQSLELPVWIQPGTADDVVVLPIGYGRSDDGKFAGSGFDVSGLRPVDGAAFVGGASVSRASGSYRLACAQIEAGLHDRPLVRSTTQTDFTEDENFVQKFEVMKEEHIESLLWEEPVLPWAKDWKHQWAMTIDLNQCTGCNACTIACQAENNIPWVGKSDVLKGREMHWIRVDRYFEQSESEVEVKYQPMPCGQCETAPCENVCPVGASAHSPEGLNDMAYNRCIGTRYCANNCPYKVRRFNFFHYTVRNDEDYGMGITMQRNPDVTVRYRGVMEKCTYCTQRIQKARIHQKVFGGGDIDIKDGAIVTACQQACPTGAIVFGDMANPDTKVAKKKKDPRNYAVLAELNIRPRTTYLAKLTNPNPELANG